MPSAVIRTFHDKRTAALFAGIVIKGVHPGLALRARTKLIMLDRAATLRDLLVPPGNRLEALTGGRAGQHAIRVNDQWRLCFRWRDREAYDVEFCDYH